MKNRVSNFYKRFMSFLLAFVTVFAGLNFTGFNTVTAYAYTTADSSPETSGWTLTVGRNNDQIHYNGDAYYFTAGNDGGGSDTFTGTLKNGDNQVWQMRGMCVDSSKAGWGGTVGASQIRIYDENSALAKTMYYGYMGKYDITDANNLARKWAENYVRDYLEWKIIYPVVQAAREHDDEDNDVTPEGKLDAVHRSELERVCNLSLEEVLAATGRTMEQYNRAVENVAYLITHHASTNAKQNIDDGDAGNNSWAYGWDGAIDNMWADQLTSGNRCAAGGDYVFSQDNYTQKVRPMGYITSYLNEATSMTVPKGTYAVVAESGGEQDIAFLIIPPDVLDIPKKFKFNLLKESANAALTDGNKCYSLQGAEYGVYPSYSDAANNTNIIKILKTDEKGYTNYTDDLDAGDYYVKELKASKGYLINNTIEYVPLNKDNKDLSFDGDIYTYTLKVTEIPGDDPMRLILNKWDSEFKDGVSQAASRIEGAKYEIKYYDVDSAGIEVLKKVDESGTVTYLNPADNGYLALRTWIFQTDERGIIDYNENYFVNGNELYKDEFGTYTLPLGMFTIQEVEAPEGYVINNTIYVGSIALENNIIQTANFPTAENAALEQPKRYGFSIGKVDYEKVQLKRKDVNVPQGKGTLITSYDVINLNDNPVIAIDKDGNYISDESGYKKFGKNEVIMTITADSVTGIASTAKNALPYGSYRIQEHVPEGYTDKGIPYIDFKFNEDDSFMELGYAIQDIPVRGGVKVEKKDALTETGVSAMGSTLEDIEFEITYVSGNDILVDGKWFKQGDVVKTIKTVKTEDGKYTAATDNDTLPYGDYTIREVKTNDDYLLTDGKERKFSVTNDGAFVLFTEGSSFRNMPVRGDIKFVKQDEDKETLALIPFLITNTLTGERHVIVTDGNGEFDSSKSPVIQTEEINGNDKVLGSITEENYVIPSVTLNPDAAVWFGMDESGNTIPFYDKAGAFQKGAYTYEELRSTNNIGRELLSGEFVIDNTEVLDLGVLIDKDGKVTVKTTAVDKGTDDHISLYELSTVYDTVHMEGLVPGKEYTLKASIKLLSEDAADLAVEGKTIKAEKTFIADNTVMDVEVKFDTFKNKDYTGNIIVVFEELYKNNKLIAEHTDINDKGQSIHISGVGTTALSESTGTHTGILSEKEIITDTVKYSGLLAGKEYTIKGVLMNKETNKPLLDKENKEITAETKFTPETSDGTVELKYELDTTQLAGTCIVVFEDVYYKGLKIASHADITDEDQSVRIPEIKTTALDTDSKTHSGSIEEKASITDTVTYTGLIPGKKYTVTGTLMDKETKKEVLDSTGGKITAETVFTPEKPDGTVDIVFEFDSSVFGGRTVVAFEEVSSEGKLFAVHADINDEEQSVHYPEIGTTASVNGKKKADVSDKTILVDTVSYKNLIPGTEYIVTGELIVKRTGEHLSNGDRIVVSQTVFTPQQPDGSIDVVFNFNSSELGDEAVVAFEHLYVNNEFKTHVISHADITDEGQTVEFEEYIEEPKTGDTTPILALILFLAISAGMIVFLVLSKKKEKTGTPEK